MIAKDLIEQVQNGKDPTKLVREALSGKYGPGATELSRTKLTPRLVVRAILDLSDKVLHAYDVGDMSFFNRNRMGDDQAEELYMNIEDNVSELFTMITRFQRLLDKTGLSHVRW